MTKFSRFLLVSFASTVLSAGPAIAAVPVIENAGVAALTSCPTTLTKPTVYYADKVVFVITGPLVASNVEDQAALDALPRYIELDVKLRDDPRKVANLKRKVLSFIGANAIEPNVNSIQIFEASVTSVVCPTGGV